MAKSTPGNSASYNYIDTGFSGALSNQPVGIHFCVEGPEESDLNYLLSTRNDGTRFRAFTGGTAFGSLWIREWNSGGADLKFPTVSGETFQSLAARDGGACIALTIDDVSAQWYVDGVAHGNPIATNGEAFSVSPPRNYFIGERNANAEYSFAYDLDEFIFLLEAVVPECKVEMSLF